MPLARLLVALLLVLAATLACELRFGVGSLPEPDGGALVEEARALAVDLLFVVDNSGSMCDDQEQLIRAFFDEGCPIQDLDDVPLSLSAPSAEEAAALESECGLAQMLAAYGVDFRVGVITTDVGPCDNRFALAESSLASCRTEPGWGRRAQRGCLQAPASFERRWLTRHDAGVGTKFRAMIESVGVFGSAFERGLDAVDVFLDPAAARAPGCEDDASSFLRPAAHLVVVFISDEDDCSHGDGAGGFVDENAGESCQHESETPPQAREPPSRPQDCYERPELLLPVEGYAARWRASREGRVSALLLGGVLDDEEGEATPAACLTLEDGAVTTACTESYGNSNQSYPNGPCDPAVVEPVCCQADAAPRYLALVQHLDGVAGSICAGANLRRELKEVLSLLE